MDDELRRLEQLVDAGDPEALEQLLALRKRLGLCSHGDSSSSKCALCIAERKNNIIGYQGQLLELAIMEGWRLTSGQRTLINQLIIEDVNLGGKGIFKRCPFCRKLGIDVRFINEFPTFHPNSFIGYPIQTIVGDFVDVCRDCGG